MAGQVGLTPGIKLKSKKWRDHFFFPFPWQLPDYPPPSNLGMWRRKPSHRDRRGRVALRKRTSGFANKEKGGLTSGL